MVFLIWLLCITGLGDTLDQKANEMGSSMMEKMELDNYKDCMLPVSFQMQAMVNEKVQCVKNVFAGRLFLSKEEQNSYIDKTDDVDEALSKVVPMEIYAGLQRKHPTLQAVDGVDFVEYVRQTSMEDELEALGAVPDGDSTKVGGNAQEFVGEFLEELHAIGEEFKSCTDGKGLIALLKTLGDGSSDMQDATKACYDQYVGVDPTDFSSMKQDVDEMFPTVVDSVLPREGPLRRELFVKDLIKAEIKEVTDVLSDKDARQALKERSEMEVDYSFGDSVVLTLNFELDLVIFFGFSYGWNFYTGPGIEGGTQTVFVLATGIVTDIGVGVGLAIGFPVTPCVQGWSLDVAVGLDIPFLPIETGINFIFGIAGVHPNFLKTGKDLTDEEKADKKADAQKRREEKQKDRQDGEKPSRGDFERPSLEFDWTNWTNEPSFGTFSIDIAVIGVGAPNVLFGLQAAVGFSKNFATDFGTRPPGCPYPYDLSGLADKVTDCKEKRERGEECDRPDRSTLRPRPDRSTLRPRPTGRPELPTGRPELPTARPDRSTARPRPTGRPNRPGGKKTLPPGPEERPTLPEDKPTGRPDGSKTLPPRPEERPTLPEDRPTSRPGGDSGGRGDGGRGGNTGGNAGGRGGGRGGEEAALAENTSVDEVNGVSDTALEMALFGLFAGFLALVWYHMYKPKATQEVYALLDEIEL